jgi:hypothetical protein
MTDTLNGSSGSSLAQAHVQSLHICVLSKVPTDLS